ncbi:MAG: hypothetical protein K9L96_05730 [Candidatus Omnitrophica bacterium]|nr:hypothetical protein [Candidatus Omnitrophota bacterium]
MMASGEAYKNRPSMISVLSGSAMQAIAGITAVILSILGLAKIQPYLMLYVSAIVLGVALMLKGAAIASYLRELIERTEEKNIFQKAEFTSGVGAETLGGGTTIILAIISLIRMRNTGSLTLMAVAAIVLGAAVVISSSVNLRLNTLAISDEFGETTRRLIKDINRGAADTQLVAGIAAIILGVLALLQFVPLTLIFVAILIIGAVNLFTGTALGGRIISFIWR